MNNNNEFLIAGNAVDLERLDHIKSTIEVLKEEIENKAYFAFYQVYGLNEAEEIVPKVISRDEHLIMVYASLISEINKIVSPVIIEDDSNEDE